jgi:hypothetical protein
MAELGRQRFARATVEPGRQRSSKVTVELGLQHWPEPQSRRHV